ncbi:hypothetical protein BTH42_30245 [Burkholderia sp. SRS-W-2-2016]|uniref:hypothetical protein n=1 Tax=Burkholderia sp. SRS-W-2-2016 TaxID=1926878 RepID=UPI00094AE1DF|nr:hypothetical protein [Burkholderia sp. SRS-W-2-2016]OLL27977.1 hypothetical protein BTH42_30245 [Burkholderia sp. SRS-W-2-2016]
MTTPKPQRASIIFYDENTGQIKVCSVMRSKIQPLLDKALTMNVPPDSADHSDQPITDEDARQVGGLAILLQGYANPELRARLQIATAEPMDWAPVIPPMPES